jgi:tRNA(Ile2) C34 agmatinyltransferase TiaS
MKWWCQVCGKQWVKKPVSRFVNTTNPVCPYCGGRTISNGSEYLCKICGRSRIKIRVQKEPTTISDLCQAPIIEA